MRLSRRVEGDVHRYTYGDMGRRARRLANALAAKDRTRCGQVAPPQGLYLVAVDYPPEIWID